MPVMMEYPPGTPCWADLSTPDAAASSAFYGGLFGWERHVPPGPDSGAYAFFVPASTPPDQAHARVVAGLMPLAGREQRPAWNTYVSVADADLTAALVSEAGGQVLVSPMDVDGQGRMAMFADDHGAIISAWQPKAFCGAGLVNEPGCLCWNELACRDTAAAAGFYGRVFGWQADTSQMGPMTYTEWRLNGHAVGGMAHMDEDWPGGIPPHWMVHFAVADCDMAAARAEELGGQVRVPPTDVPPGRFAVVADPHGAVFTIIALAAAG
jgi:predicted enzyme related to lactoylglutathione lyase